MISNEHTTTGQTNTTRELAKDVADAYFAAATGYVDWQARGHLLPIRARACDA